jgi:hypothetical protein
MENRDFRFWEMRMGFRRLDGKPIKGCFTRAAAALGVHVDTYKRYRRGISQPPMLGLAMTALVLGEKPWKAPARTEPPAAP